MLKNANATKSDVDGFTDMVRSISGVEVSLMIFQQKFPPLKLLILQQLIQEEKSLKNIYFYSLVSQLPISEFSSNPPSELSAPKVQISKFLNLPGYLYL